MSKRTWKSAVSPLLMASLLAALPAWLASGQATMPQADPQASAPLDLRSALTPAPSEMRLVAQRYDADRILLSRFYDVSISNNRIARLKRFEMSWLDALQKLDASKLSDAAKTELQTLIGTVDRNLASLDPQAATNAQLAPYMPFAPALIALEEARRRTDPMDAEKAAGMVAKAVKDLDAIRTQFQAQLSDPSKPPTIKINAKLATSAAEAVQSLQNNMRAWYGFYNEYDPMFSWWMPAPYKELDAALADYASLLKDKIAPAASTDDMPAAPIAIAPSAPRSVGDVPDLQELLAFPGNELRGVIQRVNASRGRGGRGGGGGGGGGGRAGGGRGGNATDVAAGDTANTTEETAAAAGAQNNAPGGAAAAGGAGRGRGAGRAGGRGNRGAQGDIAGGGGGAPGGAGAPPAERRTPAELLAAMKQIDFDKLSRNAQVDYLHLRNNLDVEQKRATLPPNTTVRKPDNNFIPGNPVGRDALMLDIASEAIAYTPEELIAIAETEYDWCMSEAKKCADEMKVSDWKQAMELTKEKHVPPGKQPDMIHEIINEDIAFMRAKKLVTVPEIDYETLRMEMMSPQRQLVNPYFTGGTLISVSYPTITMSNQDKLESMRGNNHGFAYATVHHELIPGHNMQGFMSQRFGQTRGSVGGTPFWGEGWSCYWEMIFYNNGFAKTPEDRMGFLFWRMMRTGRIVFSLNFHLGKMSPNECVDYLVDKVGSERLNAQAEVRRSFGGGYSAIYQAAYLLGAIELRNLHKEMVESGKLTEMAFHDTIIHNGPMPITFVRLSVNGQKLSPDMDLTWHFAGEHPTH